MKKGIITEIDWEYIGAVLARESDVEQSVFFKSMLKEMSTWGTSHQVEKQLCCINMKLSEPEKEALKMLSYQDGD